MSNHSPLPLMRKVILHTGVSLDGFIARSNGSIDWLTCVIGDHGYSTMLMGCDTVLMGRKTFDQVVKFVTVDKVPFPYSSQNTIVFSRSDPKKVETGGLPVTVTNED